MKNKQSLSSCNLRPTRFCLSILEILTKYGVNGMSLNALAESLSQPKSTVHRYLKTLVDCGWVESVGSSKSMLWKPSSHFIKLAFSYRNAVREQVKAIEEEFKDLTGEEL
ncbi:Putative transcriptional regulator IciR family [Vibrio harveyi]|uniref:helix-turn-helix domain-containing protein n=1 Tax=Vibrio harveyi TaxID=669 RepID=UPI0028B51177|nr:helix-turn-helix domain-containing protein [Vibrio harveyi]CAK6715501.1 Putative transcriptional regulator IciR family [Vibrio harveyi]HDZ3728608.1 helix-turn-helix domain-containing protein [Vibrio harveyi]